MYGNFGRVAGFVTLKGLRDRPQLGRVNELVLQTHITSMEAPEMRRGLQKTVHGMFCASLEYVESDRCREVPLLSSLIVLRLQDAALWKEK